MKKLVYLFIFSLLVLSGLLFANSKIKNEAPENPSTKPLSFAERNAELKKWEATPSGAAYLRWEASPTGKKVSTAEAKIRRQLNDYTDMEAVITSLSLPPGSRLGFGMMAKINGEDYIVTFEPNKSESESLKSLKVNDRIIIRSRNVSHAPKYAYPIVTTEHAERNGKLIYKRVVRKDGC